jgi:hypothetical protein
MIDNNTENVSKDFNSKVTVIKTSMKTVCETEKKARENELNRQCLVEAKAWADDLTKKHKSRESLLKTRIE